MSRIQTSKGFLGWRRQHMDHRDFMFAASKDILQNLPANTNLCNTGFMPPVYDQGQIGSCTGNAVGGILHFIHLKEGHPDSKFTPSRLMLYYLAREMEGTVNIDAGAEIRDVIKASVSTGTAFEDDPNKDTWPYDTSKFSVKPSPAAYSAASNFQTIQYYSVPQISHQLRGCLANGYPFVFGFMVYPSFESDQVAKTGVVPMPGRRERPIGGHAVVCVGYDDVGTIGPARHFLVRNSWGCYDKETQILTSEGWCYFRELTDESIVATLNPNNQTLEYQKITERQTYDYEGELFKYFGQGIDLLVTPNHNMYIGSRDHKRWQLIQADKIINSHFRFKKSANWEGKELLFYVVGGHVISMDLWLEFLGYFISEGSAAVREYYRYARDRYTKNGTSYVESGHSETYYPVSIFQSKQENIDKIQKCLNKLPFSFTKINNGWATANKGLCEELVKLGGLQHNRKLPDYIRTISMRQSRILLEALMLGDGTFGKQSQDCYYTSSKNLADDFQELALRSGYAADIRIIDRIGRDNGTGGITRHIEYQVSLKMTRVEPHAEYGWNSEKSFYKGKVYCVTVPNHILYVRRNGKAVWCGNSNWGQSGYCWMPYEYLQRHDLSSDFWVIYRTE